MTEYVANTPRVVVPTELLAQEIERLSKNLIRERAAHIGSSGERAVRAKSQFESSLGTARGHSTTDKSWDREDDGWRQAIAIRVCGITDNKTSVSLATRRLYGVLSRETKTTDVGHADAFLMALGSSLYMSDIPVIPGSKPAAVEMVETEAWVAGKKLKPETVARRASKLYDDAQKLLRDVTTVAPMKMIQEEDGKRRARRDKTFVSAAVAA